MIKTGFEHDNKRIYYLDCQGKDISFERWRISGYYAHHLATTIFFESESEYNAFIEKNQPFCYDDYRDYRQIETIQLDY